MRLKISTIHPLGPFKAWFALDDEAHTIAQLKCALCARLPIGMQADNITLVMDEYDLLDESPISILRDGDAVCIKRAAATSRPSLSSNRVPLPATQKRKRRASTSSEPSSSSCSSSDSSDDSSSSSSSSDSDSDSDTDAPKPPRQPPGKRATATTQSKTLQDNISFVPPGYGKPSTRNRNLRRRRKRVAEHNEPPDEPLAPTSGANAVLPLPIQQNSLTRTSSEVYVADAEPEPNVMMVSLRNKNKKKNFRQLMDKPLPPKIVFAELENAPAQADPRDKLAPAGTSNSEKVAVLPVKHARLIPPSERDGLPSNIFVTSVDVEEGQRSKKKRRSKEELVTASYDNESCTADLTLDYGLAEVPMTNPGEALHLRAEQQWDLLPKLTSTSQVKVDNVVAYKGLAINPMTWTPEMLIKVARVMSLSSTHVTTSTLQRPAQISFGGTDVTEAEEEDETYTWAEILSQDWRVVR